MIKFLLRLVLYRIFNVRSGMDPADRSALLHGNTTALSSRGENRGIHGFGTVKWIPRSSRGMTIKASISTTNHLHTKLPRNDDKKCENDKKKTLSTQLSAFITSLILIFNISNTAKADTMDTIIDSLSSLTCETQGVGDLIRSEFSHTCIPAPFFTFVVANLVSPGLYANTMLRLKINDDDLFPGACKRENRIDFNDQKLSFAMCNNIQLTVVRATAIADSAVAIASSIFTGESPWGDIKDAWSIPKSDYHEMFLNKREGDSGMMIDIGIIPFFPWKVIKEQDRMCVATQGFSGWIAVGCKYIKEPYPISIYSEFMDGNPQSLSQNYNDVLSLTKCGNTGGCYKRAIDNSKTGIVMSGTIIECVKQMVSQLMISNAVCNFDDALTVLGSPTRTSSALFQFQVNMHKFVSALLTIYVIFFGFRIVLSGDIPPKAEIVNFGVKFLFVVYFSVGINATANSTSDLDRLDGMIQWAFPFLLDGMTQLATWVINASPSELCKFYSTDYSPDMSHMALWDSLDCRVTHYLGLDVIQSMIVQNAAMNHDFTKLDVLSYPIPPYIYLLVPAVITGNFTLVSLALMYPLMVISVGAFVVNAVVVCMISIVILGVLAPLFVPMYLFNYTKGYFEAWVKLLISFMLQPMVAVTFMTTLLSVYDFGFYGTCKYKYKEISFSGEAMNMTTLSGSLGSYTPGVDGGRAIRYYYLDNDWEGSGYTNDDKKNCINSLGFILNNPGAWLFDTGETVASEAVMPWIDDASGGVNQDRFNFLKAIQSSPGMFFDMVEVLFEKIRTLALSLLTACLILYLMQHFSESLADFAADMTEGVSIGNMAINPQTLYNAGMKAISMAGGAKKGGKGGKGGGGGGGSGGGGGGGDGGGASDKSSRTRQGVSDLISKGSSGGEKDESSSDKGEAGGIKDTISTVWKNVNEDSQGNKRKSVFEASSVTKKKNDEFDASSVTKKKEDDND